MITDYDDVFLLWRKTDAAAPSRRVSRNLDRGLTASVTYGVPDAPPSTHWWAIRLRASDLRDAEAAVVSVLGVRVRYVLSPILVAWEIHLYRDADFYLEISRIITR